MNFPQNLRLYRELRRLSKKKLSVEAKIARERITDLEKRKGNPTLKTILALANALKVEAYELLRSQEKIR